jgi:hypothetical protein
VTAAQPDDSAAIATLHNVIAERLTDAFGKGHWSYRHTEQGVQSSMKRATKKPWAARHERCTVRSIRRSGTSQMQATAMYRPIAIQVWTNASGIATNHITAETLPFMSFFTAAASFPDVRIAEYGGIDVGGVTWRALALSGAIAGIGGLNYVLGYKHYYEEGFATGAGFLGIAVALVGRSHPIGIGLAALLFATLSQGGLAVNALVPKQMVDVLQAVVILAVATSVPEVRRLLRMRRGGSR